METLSQAGKGRLTITLSDDKQPCRTRDLRSLSRSNRNKVNLSSWRLRIEGDVLRRVTKTFKDLKKLPTTALTEDFRCIEGWVVKDVLWEGVSVSNLVQRENLKPEVKFLLFCSGNYSTALSLKKAFRKNTILAFKKSSNPFGVYHGGPIRLVFKGHNCYESVKSVDRIIAVSSRVRGTAREIATSRLQK